MRALLSVYDKTGLVELAAGLVDMGWDLVASGGTAEALERTGIAHIQVPDLTGVPEMLGGRVKTLHPAVHGGILADRSKPDHLADLDAQGIVPIDLVVCNLYPFASDPSIEMIDVGGPTMVRAAAKNHDHVGILVDPSDYDSVVEELRHSGALSSTTRLRLARAAFAHTAAYDASIVEWFDSLRGEEREVLPSTLHLTLERARVLRYGENPHQHGARYRFQGRNDWWDSVVQHSGTQLSYLNIFDTDAAWRLVHELGEVRGLQVRETGVLASQAAAVIVKHANPCGAAVGADLATAYRLALECDPVSAFGGIVALGGLCDEEVAIAVAQGPQADVIIAESWMPSAIEILTSRRRATRLLESGGVEVRRADDDPMLEVRSISGGFLVQDADRIGTSPADWQVVTKAVPDDRQWLDLDLAWRVCMRTSSNAVVVATHGQAVGVGAGQQSRVEASEIAVRKAGERAAGAVAASDAFFPFRDGLDVLAVAGVRSVVQPGGSINDGELIAAADELGIAMVMTGERHFRH